MRRDLHLGGFPDGLSCCENLAFCRVMLQYSSSIFGAELTWMRCAKDILEHHNYSHVGHVRDTYTRTVKSHQTVYMVTNLYFSISDCDSDRKNGMEPRLGWQPCQVEFSHINQNLRGSAAVPLVIRSELELRIHFSSCPELYQCQIGEVQSPGQSLITAHSKRAARGHAVCRASPNDIISRS
jgi:hypothetical protein